MNNRFVAILSCGFFLSTSVGAFAEEDPCVAVGSLAKTIMEKRQDNFPMTDLMGIVNQQDPMVQGLMRTLIIAAYDHPAYSTDEVKQREISDFENMAALECYKGTSGYTQP